MSVKIEKMEVETKTSVGPRVNVKIPIDAFYLIHLSAEEKEKLETYHATYNVMIQKRAYLSVFLFPLSNLLFPLSEKKTEQQAEYRKEYGIVMKKLSALSVLIFRLQWTGLKGTKPWEGMM